MTKANEQALALSEGRVIEGWREGRPVEDPEKTKRWGLITAKPSEYLVHCRRGRVLGSSGQGATCFKWPWDSVAVVPTSLQRISFVADQVTAEKVGVQVTGLAVYRIVEPLIAFRVLNFSYAERAQENRASLDRDAREAKADADRRGAVAEAESRRQVERSALDAKADIAARESEIARERAEARMREAVRAAAREVEEARARIEAHEALVEATKAAAEIEKAKQDAELARRRAESEAVVAMGLRRAELDAVEAKNEEVRAGARARVALVENLPALAGAVGERFGEVRVTQIGGEGQPFGNIAQAVASVIELAREGLRE